MMMKKSQKKRTKTAKYTPNTDYGPNVEEPEDELMLASEIKEVINRLKVTDEEQLEIEHKTVGQFGNDLFEQERRQRLTASMFGRVMKRKQHTPCHNLVKACLKTNHFWSQATEFGIAKEKVAIALFENKTNLKVRDSGLWVDTDNGFLGASPDGVIESENALVEVKCLFSVSQLKLSTNTWTEIVQTLKNKICLEERDVRISLKKSHTYYYQIQGQLNIARMEKCYFVVYANDNVDLFIEVIQRDVNVWNRMLPTLTKFYIECIAPEIVLNYIGQGKRCRDPLFIKQAIAAFEEKKLKKKERKENADP